MQEIFLRPVFFSVHIHHIRKSLERIKRNPDGKGCRPYRKLYRTPRQPVPDFNKEIKILKLPTLKMGFAP